MSKSALRVQIHVGCKQLGLDNENPAVLALQQGTQVNQMTAMLGGGRAAFSAMAGGIMSMLNPISLATIAIIGLGAAGIQALSGLRKESVSLEDALEALKASSDRLARTDGLAAAPNAALAGYQQLIDVIREVDELERSRAAVTAIQSTGLPDAISRNIAANSVAAQIQAAPIPFDFMGLDHISEGNFLLERTIELMSASKDEQAEALDGMVAALELRGILNSEVKTYITQLSSQLGITDRLVQQEEERSSLSERATNQLTEIVDGYAQQAELSRTILAHGERSAQVEALRNRHAREALESRLERLGVEQDSVEAAKAMAALEELQATKSREAAAARQASISGTLTNLSSELVIATAILRYGQDSEAVERRRTEQAQETVRARLSELGANQAQLDLAEDLVAAERERRREIERSRGEQQAETLLRDLETQEEIARAILTHGRDSLQVRHLQVDAARTAFEQQVETLNVSRETRDVLLEQWEATNGLSSADPFGRASATQQLLSQQSDTLAQLQLELNLVGQGETVRRRVLAIYEAEVQIRQRGIDAASTYADQIRNQAAAAADLRAELERQVAAWDQVGAAAESVLDGPLDSLLDGDFSGAIEAFSEELRSTLVDLSIRNPLKNVLLGSDLGTLQDVGGLGGIFSTLIGGSETVANSVGLARQAAAMAVTTPLVTINAGAISGIDGLVGGVGQDFLTGLNAAGLAGPEAVQREVWDFFSGKGLAPHHVAAIMGNVSAESGFNPLAVGDNGHAFGLFQHNDRSANLFDFIGGRQNLGNVQAQLEFAWHELMTSENGVLQRLLASQNLYEANAAFIGFERPSGWTPSNPQGGHGWDRRLASAEAAMVRFSDTTNAATQNLGILGQGFDLFGSALGGLLQGTNGGSNGSGSVFEDLFSSVFPAIGGLLKLPGFSTGGPTGGSDPSRIAGFVHEEEFVFDATSTARIGVDRLEAIRRGGAITQSGGVAAPANVSFQPIINVHNNSSTPTNVTMEPEPGSGGRAFRLVLSDQVGQAMTQPGGGAQKVLRSRYNVKPLGTFR